MTRSPKQRTAPALGWKPVSYLDWACCHQVQASPKIWMPEISRANESAETGERVLRSDALLQGHSHISIVHNGETYQLRATRLGKLILTK